MKKLSLRLLTDNQLAGLAGARSFWRGRKYYEEDRVSLVSSREDSAHFRIVGRRPYNVELFPENGHLGAVCSCPHAGSGEFCKHMVAAGLYLRRELVSNGTTAWRQPLEGAIAEIQAAERSARARPYFLFFSLIEEHGEWYLLPYTLQVSRVFELTGKSVEGESDRSIQQLIRQNPWLGSQARPVRQALDAEDCINASGSAISVANVIRRSENSSNGYAYYGYTRPLEDYLSLLQGGGVRIFLGDRDNPLKTPVRLWDQPADMDLSMSRADNGDVLLAARVRLDGEPQSIQPGGAARVSTDPMWVLTGRDLFTFADASEDELRWKFLSRPLIRIPKEDESEFLEDFLLPLADRVSIVGEQITWEEIHTKPDRRLVLLESDGELVAELKFVYGEVEVPFDLDLPEVTTRHKADGTWTLLQVHRDPDFEEKTYRSISGAHTGLKYYRGDAIENGFTLRAGVEVVDFLLKKLPVLIADGFDIYGEEQLTLARVNRAEPTLSLVVSSGIDWFDLKAVVRFSGVEADLSDVRRALRKRKKFVKLADGSIGELPDEWVRRYRHLFGLGRHSEDGVRLSRHHFSLVDELLRAADESAGDEDFQTQLQQMRDFKGIRAVPLPENFKGELRAYQVAGYQWLHFLKEHGFGGCLADDMGLGKTIQILAYLQSQHESGADARASLVVLPRSLLFNWRREAERFTPDLRILEHFGPGRSKNPGDFDDYDIVMTTYGTMRRDIQFIRNYRFANAVLDESQAIKNPMAQVSKAARLLNADQRFVMTGTPVENSTFELWSQFTFLNPGMLGKLEYFKREFARPIERDQDEAAAQLLQRLVYPFILRRTKSQVAPELPPRTERTVYAEMDPSQKRVYRKVRNHYRGLVLGMIEENGLDDTRMKILEGLLRLRQVSNHPALVEEAYEGKSAKLDMLLEHLQTLRSEGHKALVFSQFVQMLKLIRAELDSQGIPYLYLDGKTRDRQARVDQFQEDGNVPFFLISLRAGGVGLNLTAADYVIHVDPWWNPAVETQAADRTHRIGQDRPVFVYKLITRDTVEEKILQLQEKKRDLADQLITADSSIFKKITPEDVENLFS